MGVQNKFGWLAAPQFAVGYGLSAVALIALHAWHSTGKLPPAGEGKAP